MERQIRILPFCALVTAVFLFAANSTLGQVSTATLSGTRRRRSNRHGEGKCHRARTQCADQFGRKLHNHEFAGWKVQRSRGSQRICAVDREGPRA